MSVFRGPVNAIPLGGLVLGLTLASSGAGADTAREWLSRLHSPQDAALRAEAEGFALGVLEGSAATVGIIDTRGLSPPRRPCPPQETGSDGIAAALALRLQSRPDWLALPAPVALLLAGLDLFPCRLDAAGPGGE